jgi:3-hydroxyacyl-CoA dehydrogenase
MRPIHRVGVLGAGTMGSRIAAHFANAGIPSLLLDLDVAAARRGIETALRSRPAAFFEDSSAAMITPGSFAEHLGGLAQCDWIIEAVAENLAIKRDLWARVAPAAASHAILSTNTSGIPLREIGAGFAPAVSQRFLGTHFFNPPRYLHLLELIPGPETDPALLDGVKKFAEVRLGKGVVPCKDTPNFIANRIGCFFGATATKIALEEGYTVEEVDELTGPLIGLPKSASFRLLDIVGLDVMVSVAGNLYHAATEDPWRERFRIPEIYAMLIERGWIGEKSGQGFYKREGKSKEIHALDLRTLEYHPAAKVQFPEAEAVRGAGSLAERLRMLVSGRGRAASFLWKLFSDVLLYSAERVPEISNRIVEIDRAMRWGYAHKLGPFELWDALGLEPVCGRLEREGRTLPANIVAMRRAGALSFYENRGRSYFDFATLKHEPFEAPGLMLDHCPTVRENPGASLKDLGDGVLCVEFHSKLNTIGIDAIEMIEEGLRRVESNYEALVIANQGEAFSAGANLMLLLLAAQDEDWQQIDSFIRRFQDLNQAIKYCAKPVIVAPFGRVLGGGCEIAMHGHRRQAAAETYIGLVEMGVGLIPAGGGCKEMAARTGDPRKVFELIGRAQVSTSAADARKLGLLFEGDGVTMNPDRLIDDAKALALASAQGYLPPPRKDVKVGGESAYALLKLGAWTFHQGGYISEYDQFLGERLAYVLSGGRLSGEHMVPEQYMLDLEREVFLSLCGNPKTQERIQFTLKTGKPLRN